jgi:AraC-like DNA-binding protein
MSASMAGTTIISELVEFNYSSFPRAKCLIPMHLHHFYQLDVVLSGRVSVRLESKKPFIGHAGDGWLIPPLLRHGYEIREPFTQASFKFHLSPHCWELFGEQLMRRHIPRELLSIAKAVGERYRNNSCLVIPEAVAVATLCLIRFLDQNKPIITHVDNLDPFRCSLWPLLEQIANTPHAGWTVGRMANACHLSSDYFSRCFHQVMGQTPQRYVVESRMRAAAAALLAEPSRPIKEIAEKTNYATIHAFSRAFRQVMGVAPAAYRRASHTL